MDVTRALRGKDLGDGVRYESQQFKRVARILLDASPHHAVPWNDMAAAVGSEWVHILFSAYEAPCPIYSSISVLVSHQHLL